MIGRIDGVLCCGNICYDIPVWPVTSVAWGRTVWVDEITFSVGGNGSNTSYSLATLGAPVRLTGMIGRDFAGEAILAMLEKAGVQSDIYRSDLPTACTVVLVQPDSDRSFIQRPGASSEVTPCLLKYDVPGFSHFHLANPFALPTVRKSIAQVMASARAANLTTSLDTGWDAKNRWIEDIGPGLPHTDLLFLNDSEAKMLTGSDDPHRATQILRDLGAKDIVMKVGRRGCILFLGDQHFEVPGFAVTAKDTTGAGDCFVGAFLASLNRGLDHLQAARVANAVGAMNVEKLGAAQGVRSWEETQAWIANAILCKVHGPQTIERRVRISRDAVPL